MGEVPGLLWSSVTTPICAKRRLDPAPPLLATVSDFVTWASGLLGTAEQDENRRAAAEPGRASCAGNGELPFHVEVSAGPQARALMRRRGQRSHLRQALQCSS